MEPVISMKDKIAKKAYEIYEKRGRKHGAALEDWLLAEKEVAMETRQTPVRKNDLTEKYNRTERPVGVGQTASRKTGEIF